MKASELIEVLSKNPDMEVQVGFEEMVTYSELTSGTEDRIEDVRAVFVINGRFVIAPDCYLGGSDIVWPATTP